MNHYLTMPYAGKLVKIIMKNASGSLGSGFTTQLFLICKWFSTSK